ncbi:bifunctional folylpolyglutamate synthase/dihydrofolate synthase [Microbacteriaceae bacterium 4G12]
MNTYEEAVSWIHSHAKFGIKPGLERMNWMLEQLDHPERRIQCVHLAGTNGKGSTLTYIRSILQAAEYKVGTFTSPYMENLTETISMNGMPMQFGDLVALVNIIKPVVEALDDTEFGSATEFEIITLMAFYYFGTMNPVDLVLLETGLGGTYDSTNVVHPVLTIITTIGHDHMHILGETLTDIAGEKAGIIKAGIPVITGVSQPEAMGVIRSVSNSKKATVYKVGEQFSFTHMHSGDDGEVFSFTGPFASYAGLKIMMKGAHQVQNASLAVMAIMYLKTYQSLIVEETHIRKGLLEAVWRGRFEQISYEPKIIVDGAHNPEGIDSLVKTVQAHYDNKKIIVLFSALGDKKIEEMITKLETIADEMIFTTFDFERAISPKLLAAHCHLDHPRIFDDWQEAIDETVPTIGEDAVFLITGSLYFIARVRKYIVENDSIKA